MSQFPQQPTSPFGPGVQQAIRTGAAGTANRMQDRTQRDTLAEQTRSNQAQEQFKQKALTEESRQFDVSAQQAQQQIQQSQQQIDIDRSQVEDNRQFRDWQKQSADRLNKLQEQQLALSIEASRVTGIQRTKLLEKIQSTRREANETSRQLGVVTATRGQNETSLERMHTELASATASLDANHKLAENNAKTAYTASLPMIQAKAGLQLESADAGEWGEITGDQDVLARQYSSVADKMAMFMSPEDVARFDEPLLGEWDLTWRENMISNIDAKDIRVQTNVANQVIPHFAKSIAATVGADPTNEHLIVKGIQDIFSASARAGAPGAGSPQKLKEDIVTITKELEAAGLSAVQLDAALRQMGVMFDEIAADTLESVDPDDPGILGRVFEGMFGSASGGTTDEFKRKMGEAYETASDNLGIAIDSISGQVPDMEGFKQFNNQLTNYVQGVQDESPYAGVTLESLMGSPHAEDLTGIDFDELREIEQGRAESSRQMAELTRRGGDLTEELLEMQDPQMQEALMDASRRGDPQYRAREEALLRMLGE